MERRLAAAVGLDDLDLGSVRDVGSLAPSVRRPSVTTFGCSSKRIVSGRDPSVTPAAMRRAAPTPRGTASRRGSGGPRAGPLCSVPPGVVPIGREGDASARGLRPCGGGETGRPRRWLVADQCRRPLRLRARRDRAVPLGSDQRPARVPARPPRRNGQGSGAPRARPCTSRAASRPGAGGAEAGDAARHPLRRPVRAARARPGRYEVRLSINGESRDGWSAAFTVVRPPRLDVPVAALLDDEAVAAEAEDRDAGDRRLSAVVSLRLIARHSTAARSSSTTTGSEKVTSGPGSSVENAQAAYRRGSSGSRNGEVRNDAPPARTASRRGRRHAPATPAPTPGPSAEPPRACPRAKYRRSPETRSESDKATVCY